MGEHSAEILEQQRSMMKARGPLRLAGVFLLATALVGARLAAETRLHPSPLWLIAPGVGLATVLLVVIIVRLSMRSLRLHGMPDPWRLQRLRIHVDLASGGFLLVFGVGLGIAGSATGHPAVWFIAGFLMLFGPSWWPSQRGSRDARRGSEDHQGRVRSRRGGRSNGPRPLVGPTGLTQPFR